MLLFVTSVFEATGKAESNAFSCCIALIPRKQVDSSASIGLTLETWPLLRQGPVTNVLLHFCWLSSSGFIRRDYELMMNLPKHPILQLTVS